MAIPPCWALRFLRGWASQCFGLGERRHGEAFVTGTHELMPMPGLVAHACNPSTPETGTGGPPWVQGQPTLQWVILPQKAKHKTKWVLEFWAIEFCPAGEQCPRQSDGNSWASFLSQWISRSKRGWACFSQRYPWYPGPFLCSMGLTSFSHPIYFILAFPEGSGANDTLLRRNLKLGM